MKRRLNYTNRQKIEHNRILIKKIDDEGIPYIDALSISQT
jgi:hypothetical protein